MSVAEPVNEPLKQFDVFLSYEKEVEKKIVRLYNILTDKYLLKVWLDIMELAPGDNSFKKTVDGINGSKLMICCITKPYPESSKCKNDITLAYTNDRNILILMMDCLNPMELLPISYAISSAQRINFFDDQNAFSWSGDNLDKILTVIGSTIGRKLHNRKPKNILKKKASVLVEQRIKFPTAVISSALHLKEKDIDMITISTEEILLDKTNKLFKEYELEQLQLKNPNIGVLSLKKFRQTSLFHVVYGYNRMALLECKNKMRSEWTAKKGCFLYLTLYQQ